MSLHIGLISDTHGYVDQGILDALEPCDEIWHAGDWGDEVVVQQLETLSPLRGVYGNIDGRGIRLRYPKRLRFEAEGLRVCIQHIVGRPGRYPAALREHLQAEPADLLLCGHSHITLVQQHPKLKLLHLNPGAAGRHGFHKVRTLLRMRLEAGNVEHLEVVELGSRSRG